MSTNKFPKMGTTGYSASARPVSQGKLVSKKGNAKGGATPDAGTATHRQGVMQPAGGASYRITAKLSGYAPENANVQANGRIVPPATGINNNFRRGGTMYGPMG